jgi:hypothetical protein
MCPPCPCTRVHHVSGLYTFPTCSILLGTSELQFKLHHRISFPRPKGQVQRPQRSYLRYKWSIVSSPDSTRWTTWARCGSFICNAYRISERVCIGIELLVISNRARRLSEASMTCGCLLVLSEVLLCDVAERGGALLWRAMIVILSIEG